MSNESFSLKGGPFKHSDIYIIYSVGSSGFNNNHGIIAFRITICIT